MKPVRLLTYITAHGFGHLAQTAEVLVALARHWPDAEFGIATALPEAVVRRRLEPAIAARRILLLPEPTGADIGMRMHDAVSVDIAASRSAYTRILAAWEAHIATLQGQMAQFEAQIVLSNIAFLPLEAAKRLGLPSVAWCSLEWASIYAHYCHGQPVDTSVQQRLRNAYACADRFVQPIPHLRAPALDKPVTVAATGRRGRARRTELITRIGGDTRRGGLVAMGGMAVPIDYQNWPLQEDTTWLISGPYPSRHDRRDADALDLPFEDLLASVDFVVSKTGYGISVESALAGTPLLYLPRPDWPEEPGLLHWNQRHNRLGVIDRKALDQGRLNDIATQTIAQTPPPLPHADGAEQCADIITALLASRKVSS